MTEKRIHWTKLKVGQEWYVWDINRLWELSDDLPIEKVPVVHFQEDIESVLDQIGWHSPESKPAMENDRQRVRDADLDYPIILNEEGWSMDGMHRLCKAWVEGIDELPARRFFKNPPPDRKECIG